VSHIGRVSDKAVPPYPTPFRTHGLKMSRNLPLKTLSRRNKLRLAEIRFCGEQAAPNSLQNFWMDACYIKKSNKAESLQAVISMFASIAMQVSAMSIFQLC
jgi:hypothetical protein